MNLLIDKYESVKTADKTFVFGRKIWFPKNWKVEKKEDHNVKIC